MAYSKGNYRQKVRIHTFLTVMIVFLAAGITCLVINLAVNKSISWSLYPIGALILVAVTSAAALFPSRNKIDVAFLALFVMVSIYLMLIRWLSMSGSGLLALGLPITFASIVSVYVSVKTGTKIKSKSLNGPQIGFFITMILFLIAGMASLIINVAVSKRMDWSLYPIGAFVVVAATWLTALLSKRNRVNVTFLVFFVTLSLYLALIHWLSPYKGWLFSLALPIAFVSTLSVYTITKSFLNIKNKFYAWAASLAALAIGPFFLVNTIVSLNGNNNSPTIGVPVCLLCSLILVVIGRLKEPR